MVEHPSQSFYCHVVLVILLFCRFLQNTYLVKELNQHHHVLHVLVICIAALFIWSSQIQHGV